MKVYTAPDWSFKDWGSHTVFLAGSIEQDKAEKWQDEVISSLSDLDDDLILFNPRRKQWDSSWIQSPSNPNFNEQVRWELEHLENSQYAAFYFDSETKAPITLLELGLTLGQGEKDKVYVCCPARYWRRGNVQMVCEKYQIPIYDHLEELIREIRVDFEQDKLWWEEQIKYYEGLKEDLRNGV